MIAGRCRMVKATRLVTLITATLALLITASPAHAQDEPGHAGLVIVHGDGKVTEQCVAFSEASISGYELLKRAGLLLNVEAGAVGTTVCSIDGEGCSYPKESCFCRCQSSPCVYWSYWRHSPEGWQYQNLGAAYTRVRNGDVEGWHWSAGTVTDSKAPPDVSFASICAAAAPSAAAPSAVTTITGSAAVSASAASAAATAAPAAPVTARVAVTDVAVTTAAPVDVQPSLGLVWGVLIALVVLPVAAFAVLALIRRQQGR